jgi:hypothetical protein
MNLEPYLHQRWEADAALCALLPAVRVVTGLWRQGGAPYATLVRKGNRTAVRTNAGNALDEVTLEIHVWHDQHDAGRAIVEQVKATFDRAAFPLAGGQKVLQMRRTGDTAVQHDDGLWQFTVVFSVRVYLPSGV